MSSVIADPVPRVSKRLVLSLKTVTRAKIVNFLFRKLYGNEQPTFFFMSLTQQLSVLLYRKRCSVDTSPIEVSMFKSV